MTDDNNDRAEQTPPPLVPPPARLNDLPRDDTRLADADARDLGRDGTTDAGRRDDATAEAYDTDRRDDATPVDATSVVDSDRRDDATPTIDSDRRDDATPNYGSDRRDETTAEVVDDRPTDPAYAERTFDEPGDPPEPVVSVDGRDETTSFATAEPPAVVEPVAPASDRTEQRPDHETAVVEPAAPASDRADDESTAEPEPADDPYARYAQGGQVQETPTEQYTPEAQYTPTTAYPPAPREFVQPPIEPKKKGNRGVGSLIALLSVILFAVLYAAIAAAIIAVQRPQDLGEIFISFVQNPLFYIPAAIFVVAFVIVVLLANRASWWAYVLGSLLVGALVYFGTIGAALVTANIYAISPSEASAIVFRSAIDPFVITAGLVAREVSLWTGAAISARGRRMRARNAASRAEYERAAEEHRAEYERPYPLA